MRIAFVIRTFERGGAEGQMTLLASGLAQRGHAVAACAYAAGGECANALQARGVDVLAPRPGMSRIISLVTMTRWLRAWSPDVIHGYMPPANLLSLALRRTLPNSAVVWGIRVAALDASHLPIGERLMLHSHRALARGADHIISNSAAGLAELRRDSHCGSVVHNGIDVLHFRPDAAARQRGRILLGVSDRERVVAAVGRLDPQKNYEAFIEMAAIVASKYSRSRFAIVGSGDMCYASRLKGLAATSGVDSRLIWLSRTESIVDVYNGLDVMVSSSLSEGFANVIAEALACGAPVVATDVGEARVVVSERGAIVPPSDVKALAGAVIAYLEQPRDQQLVAARHNWIADNFSVDTMVNRTEEILARVVGAGAL